jgi:hypothetical protein
MKKFIYKITNQINHKSYIGQAINTMINIGKNHFQEDEHYPIRSGRVKTCND